MGNQKKSTMDRILAKYIDKQGEIDSVIVSDGQKLRLDLNGLKLSSRFLDDFKLIDDSLVDKRFEFSPNGELTNFKLFLKIPIRLKINNDINFTYLDCELNVKPSKRVTNGNDSIANFKLQFENEIIETGDFNLFESGFLILNKKLPAHARLICCFNCSFSDYGVYGQGFWGTMSCYKNIKDRYLKVQDKYEYMEIMNNYDRMVSETFYCDDFETRRDGTGYRG
jgi:hypothetical protein